MGLREKSCPEWHKRRGFSAHRRSDPHSANAAGKFFESVQVISRCKARDGSSVPLSVSLRLLAGASGEVSTQCGQTRHQGRSVSASIESQMLSTCEQQYPNAALEGPAEPVKK